MEVIPGEIKDIAPNGMLTITAKYDNIDRFIKRQYKAVEIGLNDGRTISTEQRNAIYALINAIADWSGDLPEGMKNLLKAKFLVEQYKGLAKQMFSLSDCDMTLARDFTKYLISFVLSFAVPLCFDIFEFIKDDNDMVKHWVWACLKHKKCAVCGKKAQLHHKDRVGMGRNRNLIVHEGLEAQPLCDKHHAELDTIGQKAFDTKYHLCGVELDKELCKIYRLKKNSEKTI